MRVFDLGLLIAGRSGVGKSELALELLGRGHQLVADDATDFELNERGELEGRCPELLQGFLEVRGLGVLNVGRMFGDAALCPLWRLDLILLLQPLWELEGGAERLLGRRQQRKVLGWSIPEITLPMRLGHNVAVLAEAACRDQKLRNEGYEAPEDFANRLRDAIRRQT